MEKRTAERVHANLTIKYFCGKSIYPGTVMNCSEKGMYIKTKIFPPIDSIFEIFILFEEEVLKVPVKVVRVERADNIYSVVGIELLTLPIKYLELLIKLNLVGQS